MARGKKIPPLHPGKVLYEDFIVPTGISIHRLAMDLRVPANRIAEIVKGERAISADTALRLARYLGTSAEFWLGLQSDYDLEKAKDELAPRIERGRGSPVYRDRRERRDAPSLPRSDRGGPTDRLAANSESRVGGRESVQWIARRRHDTRADRARRTRPNRRPGWRARSAGRG